MSVAPFILSPTDQHASSIPSIIPLSQITGVGGNSMEMRRSSTCWSGLIPSSDPSLRRSSSPVISNRLPPITLSMMVRESDPHPHPLSHSDSRPSTSNDTMINPDPSPLIQRADTTINMNNIPNIMPEGRRSNMSTNSTTPKASLTPRTSITDKSSNPHDQINTSPKAMSKLSSSPRGGVMGMVTATPKASISPRNSMISSVTKSLSPDTSASCSPTLTAESPVPTPSHNITIAPFSLLPTLHETQNKDIDMKLLSPSNSKSKLTSPSTNITKHTSRCIPHITPSRHDMFAAVVAGCLAGFIIVLRTVSYAQFIFTGPLLPYASSGLSSLLFSGIISQLIYLKRAHLKGLVSGSASNATPLLASTALAIANAQTLQDKEQGVVMTVFITLLLSGLVSGLVMFAMGRFRIGRYLQFFPVPVLRGVFGAIGLTMMVGGFNMAIGFTLSADTEIMNRTFQIRHIFKLITCILFALSLKFVRMYQPKPLYFPGFILSTLALFYIGIFSTGWDINHARSAGWIFDEAAAGTEFYSFWKYVNVFNMSHDMFSVLSQHFVDLAALVLIIIFDMSLNLPVLQEMDRSDKGLNLNRELETAGIAAIAASVTGGGGVSYLTLSPSKINIEAGGGISNISSYCALLVNIACFLAGPQVVSVLPPSFVGGLLAYGGLAYFLESVWDSRFVLTRLEYLVLLVIIVCCLFFDILISVGLGICFACALFVIKYSSLPFARMAPHIETYMRSHHLRTPQEVTYINQHKEWVSLIHLSGFLFFGSVDKLASQVRHCILSSHTRVIVFDFRMVSGIDASALETLVRVLKLAHSKKITVCFTSLQSLPESRKYGHWKKLKKQWKRWRKGKHLPISIQLHEQLRRAGLLKNVNVFSDLNMGKAWCENRIILPSMKQDQEQLNQQPQMLRIDVDAAHEETKPIIETPASHPPPPSRSKRLSHRHSLPLNISSHLSCPTPQTLDTMLSEWLCERPMMTLESGMLFDHTTPKHKNSHQDRSSTQYFKFDTPSSEPSSTHPSIYYIETGSLSIGVRCTDPFTESPTILSRKLSVSHMEAGIEFVNSSPAHATALPTRQRKTSLTTTRVHLKNETPLLAVLCTLDAGSLFQPIPTSRVLVSAVGHVTLRSISQHHITQLSMQNPQLSVYLYQKVLETSSRRVDLAINQIADLTEM